MNLSRGLMSLLDCIGAHHLNPPPSSTEETLLASTPLGAEVQYPGISTQTLTALCTNFEDILQNSTTTIPAVVVTPVPGKTSKKGKEETPSSPGMASLLTLEWKAAQTSKSAVKKPSSTAHQRVMKRREDAMESFCHRLREVLTRNRDYCSSLKQQEAEWKRRWDHQVDSLKNFKQ